MRVKEKDGDMIITDFSEIEAYKIACKIESDGLHFYKKLREKVKDEKAKETIDFLLEEEKEHLRIFEKMLFDVREKQEDAFEEDDLLSSMDYGIFKPYENIENLENILNDQKRAINLGLAIEDKCIIFYEACKNMVKDEKTKEAISKIIKDEYKHREQLKKY